LQALKKTAGFFDRSARFFYCGFVALIPACNAG
jgi:hypothetical protein